MSERQASHEEEPAVLGAAATVPVERRRRRHGEERRPPRRTLPQPRRGTPPDSQATARAHDGVEYVFEPHSSTTPPLRPYLASLFGRRRFMFELAKAGVRRQRSSTVMGSLWGVLDPLFQAGIYFLLFTIIRQGARPIEFLHVLIAGIFLFQLALTSLNDGGRSIRQSKQLMLNSTFPRAVLPLSTVCKGVIMFLPAIGVYAAFHVALQAPIGWGLALLPLLFLVQLVMMVGVSLLASTVVVFFTDASNLIQYIQRLLFFTSPVIYPQEIIPEGIRSVLEWQPFFPLFACYQQVFSGDMPDLAYVLMAAGWALGFLVIGGWLFLRHERQFAMRL